METATTTTAAIKIEVIARETIKPSSPTLPHLRSFKLSLLDQVAALIHSKLVLFYAASAPGGGGGSGSSDCGDTDYSSLDVAKRARERSQCLKKSLSEILTRFYPLAGRTKDHLSVDCNDAGADYIEARANCTISDVLQQPKPETLRHFVPPLSTPLDIAPFLLVQATFLKCGGMALGMSVSHKIADAATFSTFIKAWADHTAATAATGSPVTVTVVVPDFTAGSSLFPPTHDDLSTKPSTFKKLRLDGISRRYVFGSSQIVALKAIAASANVPKPTRVEAVSALLWKCAMTTKLRSRRLVGGGGGGCDSRRRRPSVSMLTWAINIRARFELPLPEHTFGNVSVGPMIGYLEIENEDGCEEMDLSNIVCHLRRSIEGFHNNYAKKLQGDDRKEVYLKERAWVVKQHFSEDVDMYGHVSWCRFPLYESDFGWGKPTWSTIVPLPGACLPGIAVLLDTKDGEGVEAWVNLAEEDIALFETNQDLFAFASLNPSAL